jgi:dihydrofolate reductase
MGRSSGGRRHGSISRLCSDGGDSGAKLGSRPRPNPHTSALQRLFLDVPATSPLALGMQTDDYDTAPLWSVRNFCRYACRIWSEVFVGGVRGGRRPYTDLEEADVVRKLSFGMSLSLDGYVAAPGDDLGWGVSSDELFQWWSDRVGATGLALYGRRLWETMSSHWPTADQQPGAAPAQIEFARRWRDMPKVVFSSTTSVVEGNTRLVTGDAVTEIARLKAQDGGPMDVGGATLAAAVMRAGLIDEYAIVTHPVLVGGGTPFFTALDNWVNLSLVETRTFPDGVLLTRYETRR